MEHHHRCVYCDAVWFCYEDCLLAGASACEPCRDRLRTSPGMTRRAVRLRHLWVFDRLKEDAAARFRDRMRRGQHGQL